MNLQVTKKYTLSEIEAKMLSNLITSSVGGYIEALKYLRNKFELGLKDARDAMEESFSSEMQKRRKIS